MKLETPSQSPASSSFQVYELKEIWKELRSSIFSKYVKLEIPKFHIAEKFEDDRIACYRVAFYRDGTFGSYYEFLPPPSERAAREAMVHEMVHHADVVTNGSMATLAHGRYFFSWRDRVQSYGYRLGRKVHWD